MASLLDRLMGAVSHRESIRGMGKTLLGAAPLRASVHGHADADVVHLVAVLIDLRDVQKALASRGVVLDDAVAVVEQLLDERPAAPTATHPTTAPRLAAVNELAARTDRMASGVIRAVATALPLELAFLRRPFEGVADDVGPLFDGALAAQKGALSFEAWDEELRSCVSRVQLRADRDGKAWSLNVVMLLIEIVALPRVAASLAERGVDLKALLGELGSKVRKRRQVHRAPPEGHVAAIGPSLFALLLRAEHYAAEDASNVRLRHVLTALHDEPLLAETVAQLAG